MIDESFVKKIAQLGVDAEAIKTIEVDGRTYASKHMGAVLLPEPETFSAQTLSAVKDYLASNPDRLDIKTLVINVLNPCSVTIYSSLIGSFQQRFKYVHALLSSVKFPFGRFMTVDEFVVGLQALFVQDEITSAILKIVGNVTDGIVKTFEDDGISQKVTAKAGVAKVAEIPVPNPVLLTPFRTFPDIEQPRSRFIFRMKSGDPAPTCALFEADGGAWRIEAMASIKKWLTENLPEGVTILA